MRYIIFFCLFFMCLNKMTLFAYDCKTNDDCDDGDSCTIDLCVFGETCQNHLIPTCCNLQNKCTAMKKGYEGYCDESDPDMPQCRQIKKPLSCSDDNDCMPAHPTPESLVWYCNMTKHPDPNPKDYEGTCYHKFKQFYCETNNDCDHLSVQNDCLNWECHSSGNCTIENFKPLCCTVEGYSEDCTNCESKPCGECESENCNDGGVCENCEYCENEDCTLCKECTHCENGYETCPYCEGRECTDCEDNGSCGYCDFEYETCVYCEDYGNCLNCEDCTYCEGCPYCEDVMNGEGIGCCQNSPCVESFCNTELVDDPENPNEGICDPYVIEDCNAICGKPTNLEGTITQNKNNFSKCKADLTWEEPNNECGPTTYHLYVQQEDENWKKIGIIIHPTKEWHGDVICRDDTLKFKLTVHNINGEGDSTEKVLKK